MVKRKRFLAVGILALVMLIGIGVVLWQYDLRTYVHLGDVTYYRDTQTLDLSGRCDLELGKLARFDRLRQLDLRGTGITPEAYEQLQSSLPDCRILWQVPFQGQYLELNTQRVKLDTLSREELYALSFLKDLKQVDAGGCTDYPMLEELIRQKPDCQVDYEIAVDGVAWKADTPELEIKALTPELERLLPYFQKLKAITLMEALPDRQTLERVEAAYPQTELRVAVGNRVLPIGENIRQLDLREEQVDRQTVEALLELMPNLSQMDLRDTGLKAREMMELWDQYPQVFFLWEVPVGEGTVPSDAEELDLSGQQLGSTAAIEDVLSYLPRLRKVVMCDCGIGNEEMDALNQRYEDIRFVWRVYVGRYGVRTDDIFFAPVKYNNGSVNEGQMGPLKYCTDMVAIDLGHMPISTCAWAENMPNLQYLILADTGVSDISPLANHDKLVFLELFITPCRDYSPLLTCKNLEDLNLCYSYGSAEPVKRMTWLKRLWWDGHPLQTKGLAECLPDTECNFKSGSSTGGTWRQGQRYKEQRDILGMPYLVG